MSNGLAESKTVTKKAICTTVSANYWAYARVFAQTLKKHQPELEIFVLLVDSPQRCLPIHEELFRTVFVEELDNLPDARDMFFKYDALELNTAVKPYFFEYLMRRHGVEKLIFCDPDIAFFAPLGELWDLLDSHSIILTPHIMSPYNDNAWPSELHVNQSGVFNLGFLGLTMCSSTLSFLKWWQEKLYDNCYMDIEKGMHVDQKWANFVPVFYPDALILRDPSYNVAYWNLHERGTKLRFQDEKLMLGEIPVVFFHFSGFNFFNPAFISKHQNRFSFSNMPHLKPLFDFFYARLAAAGHPEFSQLTYAFGIFDNGMKISGTARRLYREAGERAREFCDPFITAERGAFWEFMLSPEKPGARGSRILNSVYNSRNDLQSAFPARQGADEKAFLRWAASNALEEYGHPLLLPNRPASVSIAARLRDYGVLGKRLLFFRIGARMAWLLSRLNRKKQMACRGPRYKDRAAQFGVNIVRDQERDENSFFIELMRLFHEHAVPFRVCPTTEQARGGTANYPITLVINPKSRLFPESLPGSYCIGFFTESGEAGSESPSSFDEIWTSDLTFYDSAAPKSEIPLLFIRFEAGPENILAQEPAALPLSHPAADRLRTVSSRLKSQHFLKLSIRRYFFRATHLFFSMSHFLWNWLRLTFLRHQILRKLPSKKIVAVARTEHLGDIVAAEPLIRRIRLQHPEALLVFFIKRGYREILAHHPCVDFIFEVQCVTDWNWLSNAFPFDAVYDLHFDGLRCQECQIPLQKKHRFSCVGMENYYHLGNLLFVFSQTAGVVASDEKPNLFIPDTAVRRIDQLCLPERYAVIHGESHDPAREWDAGKWRALSRVLQDAYGLIVVEVGLSTLFKEPELPGKLNLCGNLSIMETAEVIRRATLFIGIDSGPSHLANALGTPSLVLLGKFLNFDDYTPFSGLSEQGNRLRLIKSRGPASTIEIQEVISAIKEIIGSKHLVSERSYR